MSHELLDCNFLTGTNIMHASTFEFTISRWKKGSASDIKNTGIAPYLVGFGYHVFINNIHVCCGQRNQSWNYQLCLTLRKTCDQEKHQSATFIYSTVMSIKPCTIFSPQLSSSVTMVCESKVSFRCSRGVSSTLRRLTVPTGTVIWKSIIYAKQKHIPWSQFIYLIYFFPHYVKFPLLYAKGKIQTLHKLQLSKEK